MTTTKACPCGVELKSAMDHARGVCTYCRTDAKKRLPRKRHKPEFEDVPILGLENWGTR